ncbi:Zinc finger, PHD-finger [Phytophthora cactorum]|nr:Zinc finger, PHD-finger [Phytophthora cactorum]
MVAKKSAACRADIPPMLSQEQRDALVYTPQCRQRWGERQIKGAASLLKAEDIEEFLEEFAWLKETELALQCLFDGEFDVPKAVGLLHAARRERYKARRGQDKRLASEVFKDALAIHGKKFHLVKKEKKTRKTKKEAERLRQWTDESDPETETSPPITKLNKDEDYFCSHCQDEFGGPKPKLVPSDESDHCMVYFPSLGVPRSLIESMTDASSYEEEDEQEDYSDDENENDGSCESSDDSDSDDNASKCREDSDIRAEIPALLSAAEHERKRQLYQPQYRQRWGWRDGEQPKLSNGEIVEFVRTYAWPKETEMVTPALQQEWALQSLFEGDYDEPKAVEIIHDARREKLRLKREEAARIQILTFERAMDRHGKKFHLLKRRFPTVGTRELVSKFYLWKKAPEYEKWHDGQREKKRKREAKRIAQQRPAADQHLEFCGVCLKGGKLLCCDGCERAYHLNCVRPALLDVPEGDWFCSHCRDVSPAKKRENLSVPGPGASAKPKTRPNGSSLKGGSDVQPASHVHDVMKKLEIKNLTTKNEKSLATSKPVASTSPKVIPDQISPEELSPNDAISDITTESESDGSAAKVFQSLSSSSAPSRKRKQHYARIETAVGRPRYSSPSDHWNI